MRRNSAKAWRCTEDTDLTTAQEAWSCQRPHCYYVRKKLAYNSMVEPVVEAHKESVLGSRNQSDIYRRER